MDGFARLLRGDGLEGGPAHRAPSGRRGPAGQAGVVSLRITTPAPRAEWRQLLERDRHALASQSPDWLDALCASGAYEDASRLYETPSGARIVLPLAYPGQFKNYEQFDYVPLSREPRNFHSRFVLQQRPSSPSG